MSSPADYYKSLPPVSKAFGTICFLTTVGYQIGLLNVNHIYLGYEEVFYRFQVWRLLTNFFFLGKFSMVFGIRLMMIARYGVQLENGPFAQRTADFLWMFIFSMLSLVVFGLPLHLFFLGPSVIFTLLYVWSREFASASVNIMGLFSVKGFYLPWAMLGMNIIFGSPILPDLMGIIVGHLYHFLTVLHPRNGGRNYLKTPLWVHNLVLRWLNVRPQVGNRQTTQPPANRGTAFTGRSYRLQ